MTLEERLAACTTTAEMQEVYHAHLAANGVIERERGSSEVRVLSEPRTIVRTAPPVESHGPLVSRVLYPHGNVRVEIEGTSQQELDAIESRVRSVWSGHA